MKNYKKSNKRKNRTKVKSRAGLALLTILTVVLAIVIPAITNMGTNETEAAETDIYDLILFWGQSNMVGSADGYGESRQGTSDTSKKVFAAKTGIDEDIVKGIEGRYKVNTGIPDGWAYEYILDPNVYAREVYGLSAWTSATGANSTNWNDSHLKPVGFDHIYGETIKAVKMSDSYQIAGTSKSSGVYDTYASGAANMVPQFCKTYYEKSGHKVIAVVCAYGGKGIDEFTPVNKNEQENGTYVVMSRKMWAAAGYIQDHRPDIKLGKYYAVSMQGENVTDVDNYEHYYREVVKGLNQDCAISKHVLCETGGTLPRGNTDFTNTSDASFDDVMKMHQAQEKLCNNYSDTILGSNYGYNSYVPMNAQDYNRCTTAVCYKPGTSTKWSFEQAVKHASLRMDYDYGYSPQSNSATSDLVRNSSMDRPDANTSWFNGIHYTSASLCQIGLEAATNLAATITSVNLRLSPKEGTCEVGKTKTFTISRDVTVGALGCESADTSIATATRNGNTVTVTAKKVGVVNIWVGSQPTASVKGESDYYQLTVTKRNITIPTLTDKTKTYNGSSQGPTVNNLEVNYVRQGGTWQSVNPGTYVVTWNLKDPDNTQWSDGTTSQKSDTWTMEEAAEPQSVSIPTISPTSFAYDGTTKTPTISGYDSATMNRAGTFSESNRGDYSITFSLKDKTNYKWSDGTTSDKQLWWSITKGKATIPTISPTSFAYDGTTKTPTISGMDSNKVSYEGTPSEKNIGDYSLIFKLKDSTNYEWSDGTTSNKQVWWSIFNPTVTIPTLSPTEFEYDGSTKTPTVTGYNSAKMNQAGTFSESHRGDYSITFSLKDKTNYKWSDGTTSDKQLWWSITKGKATIPTISPTEFTYDGTTKTPTISGMDSNKVSYEGTPSEKNAGDYSIIFKLKDSTNYEWSDGTTSNKQVWWSIKKVGLNDATITLNPTSYTYDGSAKTPTTTVKVGNTTLTKDTDYIVSVSNNTNAGTATLTINGKGNYTGNKSATFTINKRELKVTADSRTRKYNEDNPDLTYQVTGNVSGETPKITGSLSTTATKTSPVGTYDIVSNNLALADNGSFKANNYSLSFTKGTLTVEKAAGSVELVSDDNNHSIIVGHDKTLQASTTGNLSASTSNSAIATVSISGNRVRIVGVKAGNATITIKSAANTNYNAAQLEYAIQVVANTVTKIQMKTTPKTSYIEGQDLDITGGKITVTYLDGTTADMAITSDMVSGFNKNNIGQQTLTVTYGNQTTTYAVVVRQKQATGIRVQTMPSKTTYIQNFEELDLSGAKIEATYDNGTMAVLDVTPEMVSGFDNTRVGDNTITVTYQGKTCTIGLRIVEKSITGIEIAELPSVVRYVQDYGILDVTDGKIRVRFDDNTSLEVDMTKDMVSGFDNTQLGTQTLTVEYEGHRTEYQVEVIEAVVTSIEMQTLPEKTTYIQNYEDLDLTGAKLSVTFNGFIPNTINVLEEMVSGFDNSKVGQNTITVRYAEQETSFNVNIVKHSVVKVEIEKEPNKKAYKQGEKIDLTGGKIKIYYNDETSEVVNMNTSMLVDNSALTTVGSKLITLKVEDQELSYEVSVVAAENNGENNGENNNGNNQENNNGNNNGSNNGNSNGSNNGSQNNGSSNGDNGQTTDDTIATKVIPQTGVNPGVVIGITALTSLAGFGIIKTFKYRFIK